MKKLLMALMIVSALVASLGASALADGATTNTQVINNQQCIPLGSGYQECISIHAVIHDTVTPSGNESYTINGTETVQLIDPSGNVIESQSFDVHGHDLTKDGLEQEIGEHINETFSYLGQSCTITIAAHYANGQIQFERTGGTCP